MFARRVYIHLKPNSVAEFTQRLEKDILPLLRKQKGFQDEISFVGQGGKEAFAISLWAAETMLVRSATKLWRLLRSRTCARAPSGSGGRPSRSSATCIFLCCMAFHSIDRALGGSPRSTLNPEAHSRTGADLVRPPQPKRPIGFRPLRRSCGTSS